MNYIVCEKRKASMLESLSEALELIDSEAHLPMFRNRQKNFPKEFKESIKIAKTKKKPSHYFAKIWSRKNCFESVKMIRKLINLFKSKKLENAREAKQLKEQQSEKAQFNKSGRDQFELMKNNILKKKPNLKR